MRPASAADLKLIAALASRLILDELQTGADSQINHWVWTTEPALDLGATPELPQALLARHLPPHPACQLCRPRATYVSIRPEALQAMKELTLLTPGIETGGILVGTKLPDGAVLIEKASGPGPNSKCSASGFDRDVPYCQAFVDENAETGLLYVGEWHSHPTNNNRPSLTDLTSLANVARQSGYLTTQPVMIIMSRAGRTILYHASGWRDQLRYYFSGTAASSYFMNFATYDILSKALPGAVVYLVLLLGKFISKPTDIGDVLTLVVIYLLGYFIDALASITELSLFWLMRGSPGERILTEDYKGRIFVAQRVALCTHLQTHHPDLEIGSRKLFAVVASVANTKGSTRLTEFQGAYAFARNILTALVIAEIIGFMAPLSWPLLLLFAGLIILSFTRVKQRGYYWAREAANIYIDCRSVGQPKVGEQVPK